MRRIASKLLMLACGFALLTGPAARTARAGDRPVVLCYGDSITFGRAADMGLGPENNWPGLLAARFPSMVIVNAGKNGRKTDDLKGLETALGQNPKPGTVILLLGVNDLHQPDPAIAGQAAANMERLIRRIRAERADARILLATPVAVAPENLTEYWTQKRRLGPHSVAELEAMRKAYAELAVREGVECIDLAKIVSAAHLPDGVHPDVEGHRLLAEAFAAALARPAPAPAAH